MIQLKAGKLQRNGVNQGGISERTRPSRAIRWYRRRLARGVGDIDAATQHGDRRAARVESASVSGGVDPMGKPADDDHAGARKQQAQLVSDLAAIGASSARADDRDRGLDLEARPAIGLPQTPEHVRRGVAELPEYPWVEVTVAAGGSGAFGKLEAAGAAVHRVGEVRSQRARSSPERPRARPRAAISMFGASRATSAARRRHRSQAGGPTPLAVGGDIIPASWRRGESASATCSSPTRWAPARSAIVRATRSTRS